MTMHSRHAVTISVPTYSQGDGQMKDAASIASQSVWRWIVQRIRVGWLSLVAACVLWWLAFTAHPAGPPLLAWLYRATVISSAVLATLKLAYSIRFGKRLD